MPFPLFDSIDGVVVHGYVDGLDNEFEQEDFNPPAEGEGRCSPKREVRSSVVAMKGHIIPANATGGKR